MAFSAGPVRGRGAAGSGVNVCIGAAPRGARAFGRAARAGPERPAPGRAGPSPLPGCGAGPRAAATLRFARRRFRAAALPSLRARAAAPHTARDRDRGGRRRPRLGARAPRGRRRGDRGRGAGSDRRSRAHRVRPLLGACLELGAEFVHGRPRNVHALAREAGVAIREVSDRHLWARGQRLSAASAPFSRAQEILALGGSDDEPFARVLARTSVRRRFGEDERELARSFVEGFYLADPRTVSSAALARMTRGLEEIGGERTYRVEGGYAALLAPLVRAPAGALRLSTAVEEVRWRPGHVEVRARGAAGGPVPPLDADRAVVTLPLGVLKAGAVRFAPALLPKRSALGALAVGAVLKVILRFRSRIWERRGARDLGFLHAHAEPFQVFWPLSREAPVVVGWSGGPAAARLSGRPPLATVRAALAALAHALGTVPQVLEADLDGWRVADWPADPHARGGYAVFPVGSSRASRVLAEPVAGTLFFAGEATAEGAAAGTVEGALETGERAAREVLASL